MAEAEMNRVEGTFRTKKSGSIEYRFYYNDEFGIRRRKSVSALTEDECLDKAEMFLSKIDRALEGIDYTATIPDILKKDSERSYKKGYTGIQGYGRRLETIKIIEKSPIGHIPIIDIKEKHLEWFLGSITSYSNAVIEKVYYMLKKAYKQAYEKGIITDNLMLLDELSRPKSKKKSKKVRGLTEDEQV